MENRTQAEAGLETSSLPYDVFISYSRADIEFARRLERTLESYKPPKGLQVAERYLEIFRDESDFTGVKYFEAVDEHLRKSSRLLVLCSPAARKSQYVDDEIRRFSRYHGADRIIPVLIAGIPNNESKGEREAEKAFPEALLEALSMPRAIEYRTVEHGLKKLDGEIFSGSWYSLLAEIYGVSREVIEQRERKRKARRRRVVVALVTSVLVSLSTALVLALISRRQAIHERNIALARQLAAQGELILQREPYLVERAALLGAESLHRLQTPEADEVVRSAVELLARPVINVTIPKDVATASLSPGGDFVAVAGESGVDVFKTSTGQRLSHIADDGMVFALAITPDGKWLLTGDTQGEIRIAAMPEGQERNRIKVEGQVTSILISPDGTHFIARSSSSTVHVWAIADGSETATFSFGAIVQSVAFTTDGQKLCAGTVNGSVDLWDLPSRRLLLHKKTEGKVLGIACTSAGLVVTATGRREVHIWSTKPGGDLEFQDHHGVSTTVFSRDEHLLALAGENRAEIFETTKWSPVARFAHQDAIEALVFHPTQLLVATASDDRTARVWDIRSGSEIARISHLGPVLDVGFDNSGRYVVSVSADQWAHVVEIGSDPGFPWEETGKPTAVDFGNARYIATGDFKGAVRIWDRETRKPVRAIDGFPDAEITAVRLSPDERLVAAATRSGEVRVWDIASGTRLWAAAHGVKVNAISFLNGTALTGGEDGIVKSWDSHGNLLSARDLGDPVTGLAISPNDKLLVATLGRFGQAPRGSAALVDLGTGQVLRRIHVSNSPVQAAAFSPDSRWLLTGGQDNRARVWDVRSGKERAAFAHEHPVVAVSLSPSGQYAATGSIDGVTRIWEIATGFELVRLSYSGMARFVQFAPDGQRIRTANFDDSGVVIHARESPWQAADLIQQVCAKTTMRLRPDDWARYLDVEPYRPVCPPNPVGAMAVLPGLTVLH